MKYDSIVVGTGISGIVKAVCLLHEGEKVLLLDEHNRVGGSSRSTIKGRFEFGSSLHDLYLNNKSDAYTINRILEKCGIESELEFSNLPYLCRVLTDDVDVTLPFGVDAYIEKLESIVPGSKETLEVFFKLALECKEALDFIYKNIDHVDYEYLKNEYNNFTRVANNSVSRVMDIIGVPLKTQEIINAMWLLFGVSETELSFVTYGVFLYNALSNGLCVVNGGNYEVALSLVNHFLELGGELKLNCQVDRILVDDGKINGVRDSNGKNYYANKVIVNSSEIHVYGKLLETEVPREALRSVNKREVGGREFRVRLGLNRSALELGLDNYMYFLYDSLDSDVEYKKMNDASTTNQVVSVINNADRNASVDGTCIVNLSTVYFGDSFTRLMGNGDIVLQEEEIAKSLIARFEECVHVNISDFIEEIEICSPFNHSCSSGIYDGATYGFSLKGLDDCLPRMLNKGNEKYILGLEVVSGFDGDAFHYVSSYAIGLIGSKGIKEVEADYNG